MKKTIFFALSVLSLAASSASADMFIPGTACVAATSSQQSRLVYYGSTVYNNNTLSSTVVRCPLPVDANSHDRIQVYLSNSHGTSLDGRVTCVVRSTNGVHLDPSPDYLIDYTSSTVQSTTSGPGDKILTWYPVTLRKFNTVECTLPHRTGTVGTAAYDPAGVGGVHVDTIIIPE